jgi:sugar O-acyltransferase (sialic acid O-acetyltransferase NeuD family)
MKYAIYSCEGFGREVIPSLRRQASGDADIVFVDDDPQKIGTVVHGCDVIDFEQLCSADHRDRQVSIAVADTKVRKMLAERCTEAGFEFVSIADATHTRFDNVTVGEGAIFCANTMVTGDATIGRHFHCNIYSYVAHDCRIGDFVTFAPRVNCNGRVEIDNFAYIGTGATLKQGAHDKPLRIGRGAIVGMGAVVLKDVGDGEVVVGNPGSVIRKIND